jgi:hypothetical protein
MFDRLRNLFGGSQPARIRSFTIKAGETVNIGAPATPPTWDFVQKVRGVCEQVDGLREAHLPMCYVEGKIDPPKIVLAVVPPAAVPEIQDGLHAILPSSEYLDVLPLEGDSPLADAVRASNTAIVRR